MKTPIPFNQDFLDYDFRSNRPPECGVPMNAQITIQKHELLLSPEKIAGKRILDIGSFIGQTADWCLNNGAAHYTGVEISSDFCATATELLTKHHPDGNWTIMNYGLEEYFARATDTFDIVFCWGVLFGHHDHVWFLNELARRGDHVILESRHPKWMWRNDADVMPNDFWYDLEYTVPYTEWQTGNMTMLAGTNASIRNTAANSSIGAVCLIMEMAGFSADLSVYEKMKAQWPDNFGMIRDPKKIGRFMIEFTRNPFVPKHALTEEIFQDSSLWSENYVDWMKKK